MTLPRLKPALILAFAAIMLFSNTALRAQLPAFTIFTETPENGAVQDGPKNIILREQRLTLRSYDALQQRGRIVIRRTAPTTATVTLIFGVSYQIGNQFLPDNTSATIMLPQIYSTSNFTQNIPSGVTPRLVPINSLQGDLTPQLYLNGFFVGRVQTTQDALNQITFTPQVTEATIVFFARWSDQSYPRNPGLQGERVVFVSLLPGDNYTIPARFDALSRITLDDPANVLPQVQTSFCSQVQPARLFDVAEIPIILENRTTPLTNTFYDDNYDSLSYSATASNQALIEQTRVSSGAILFRPSNIPQWRTSTAPTLTITARDQRGGSTSQTCSVTLMTSSVQENTAKAAFFTAPNPTSSETRLSYTLTEPSAVRIEVFSTLGERVMTLDEGMKPSGEHTLTLDASRLATGVYPVRLTAGRTTQAVMMRVLR